jgi:hypothetical protein
MPEIALNTREMLAIGPATPSPTSGGHLMSANGSGGMKIVKASSAHWKIECVALARAGEIFMVDEFHQSSVLFFNNLCYVFRYHMVMTGLSVFLSPRPAP